MAELLSCTVAGCHYRVVQAGSRLRLYTDGVFHSEFDRRNILGGSVWDLLVLPAFLQPAGRIRRVLVLGVGGGAALAQIQALLSPDLIVGVELNPFHLNVARRYFGLSGQNVELVCADARAWLEHYRGPAFDLIIDDVFGESAGEPCRVFDFDPAWLLLRSLLSERGILVGNFDAIASLNAAILVARQYGGFASAFELATPGYANAVAAFCVEPSSELAMKGSMASMPESFHPLLRSKDLGGRLNYTLAQRF